MAKLGVLVVLAVAVLAACLSVFAADSRKCVEHWPLTAPLAGPNMLHPTLQERMAGWTGAYLVTLKSASHGLPSRSANSREVLGHVRVEFAVHERLEHYPLWTEDIMADLPGSVRMFVDVGYWCEYPQDDERDLEALAVVQARLEEYFGNRLLIVFVPGYHSVDKVSGSVSFDAGDRVSVYFHSDFHSGTRWLLPMEEGTALGGNPQFVDWFAGAGGGEARRVSLDDVRRAAQEVMAEELERGVDCVEADYSLGWHERSGEVGWYDGFVDRSMTPVECLPGVKRAAY